MRHLERSILLQVIDNRWREHLYDMDYLREGIHLRGFAQIDPLVAYKNEGFSMFEELMHSIWEEFSKLDLPRRGRSPAGPGRKASWPATAPPSRPRSTTRAAPLEAQPSALQQVAAQGGMQAGQSAEEAAEAALGNGGPASRSRRWSRTSTTRSAATTPAGAARARSTRSATAPERRPMPVHDPDPRVHPRLQRARPRRASSRSSTRRSSCTRCAGCARGSRRRGSGRRGRRAGCSRRSSWSSSTRTRRRASGRAVALIRRRWHWDEDGSEAGVDEMAWLFELRDNRVLALAPVRRPAEALRSPALTRTARGVPSGRGVSRSIQPGGHRRLERAALRRLRRLPRPRRSTASAPTARRALEAHPPRSGDRVIDLGCGFGDTTQELAELVGPEGEAFGVDVAAPFIEQARREAEGGPATSISRSSTSRSASSARATTTPSRGWG